MEFDILNLDVVPFSVTEQDIKDTFIDWVIEGDNTPIDIACRATISEIKKIYYPIRCFDIVYSTDWSATSIWEHKESYTEYEPKTVYIDYYGKEHSSPGFDNFAGSSGNAHYQNSYGGGKNARPFTPQQKMIPVTKSRIVTDKIDQTYGSIKNIKSFQRICFPDETTSAVFANWINSISIENCWHYNKDYFENCEIKSLIGSDEDAWLEAQEEVIKIASVLCKNQVPGNRFENLNLNNFTANYDLKYVMLPVFCVTYDYMDKKYQMWINGISKYDTFHIDKPIDNSLSNMNQHLEEEKKKKGNEYLKYFLLSFIAIPVLFFICLIFAFALSIAKGSSICYLLLFAVIVLEIISVKKFIVAREEDNKLENSIKNHTEQLNAKRKQIAAIVKDSKLNNEEKDRIIFQILNER